MPDLNQNADLVARLREKRMRVHDLSGVGWADDPDCLAAANLIEAQAAEISRLRDALSDGDAIVARLREIINSGIEGKPGYETDKEIYAQMHGQVMRLLSWDAPRRSSTALEAKP